MKIICYWRSWSTISVLLYSQQFVYLWLLCLRLFIHKILAFLVVLIRNSCSKELIGKLRVNCCVTVRSFQLQYKIIQLFLKNYLLIFFISVLKNYYYSSNISLKISCCNGCEVISLDYKFGDQLFGHFNASPIIHQTLINGRPNITENWNLNKYTNKVLKKLTNFFIYLV